MRQSEAKRKDDDTVTVVLTSFNLHPRQNFGLHGCRPFYLTFVFTCRNPAGLRWLQSGRGCYEHIQEYFQPTLNVFNIGRFLPRV